MKASRTSERLFRKSAGGQPPNDAPYLSRQAAVATVGIHTGGHSEQRKRIRNTTMPKPYGAGPPPQVAILQKQNEILELRVAHLEARMEALEGEMSEEKGPATVGLSDLFGGKAPSTPAPEGRTPPTVAPPRYDIVPPWETRPIVEIRQMSPRQRQAFALVMEGWTNADIAERMGVTEGSVKSFVRNVYERLGVHTRASLVNKYLEPWTHTLSPTMRQAIVDGASAPQLADIADEEARQPF